jgi:2-oxopent-4-enoate/cis-2-oxohex-4-enoate hydratase
MADDAQVLAWGDELYTALRTLQVVPPLTERDPSITIALATAVSQRLLARRLADGERVVGKKIGVTSAAVQQMLGVFEPDFGWLTDAMQTGSDMLITGVLIQPRAEAEIALVLDRDLVGPGITPADVLAATASVHACFEVVDSRIRDWKIRIQDTIADNASSGLFVVGEGVSPAGVDLEGCLCEVTKNGVPLSQGYGRAVQGTPLASVAWLANTLGRLGVPLRAGEVILSGSLVPLEPVSPGDVMTCTIAGIGRAEVRFR